jgi:hypothetical protein
MRSIVAVLLWPHHRPATTCLFKSNQCAATGRGSDAHTGCRALLTKLYWILPRSRRRGGRSSCVANRGFDGQYIDRVHYLTVVAGDSDATMGRQRLYPGGD